MIGFRGVTNQTVFIGNFCLLAGLGLFISAQWEMVRGNTFAYTVLAAFGKPLLHRHKAEWEDEGTNETKRSTMVATVSC
jgi:succinate-acetate transporter protein